MKTFLKWAMYVLGGIVALLIIGGVAAFTVSNGKIGATYDVAGHALAIPADSAGIERGHHLSMVLGCAECHGENLGGQLLIDASPFAVVHSPNLTSGDGGAAQRYDDAGLERAIRHGVGSDDRSLVIMPAEAYNSLSDQDVAAIIAWLRQTPPVDNQTPPAKFGPVGRALIAANQVPGFFIAPEIDHSLPHLAQAPPVGPTVEYGEYLTRLCTVCHGENLAGSTQPGPDGSPPALNLTPVGRVSTWTVDEFRTAMRTGVTPNGYELNPDYMPWRSIGRATDDELEAIYLHLKSLPPAEPSE